MQYRKISSNPRRRAWVILVIILVVSLVSGVWSAYADGTLDTKGLVGNLSTELIGGVITFILIDRFITQSVDKSNQKKSLISQLENHDSGIVKRVMQELNANGWLQDGSLYGWFLQNANFSGLDLRKANVNGLGLFQCRLEHARVYDKQLASLTDLRRTTLPDGRKYDGRYCLHGDIAWAKTRYGIDFNDTTVEQMAKYYEVPLEDFIAGQRWAIDNLPELGYELPPYLVKLNLNGEL